MIQRLFPVANEKKKINAKHIIVNENIFQANGLSHGSPIDEFNYYFKLNIQHLWFMRFHSRHYQIS